MAELGALVGHTSQRIETVEMNNKQLGEFIVSFNVFFCCCTWVSQ